MTAALAIKIAFSVGFAPALAMAYLAAIVGPYEFIKNNDDDAIGITLGGFAIAGCMTAAYIATWTA